MNLADAADNPNGWGVLSDALIVVLILGIMWLMLRD